MIKIVSHFEDLSNELIYEVFEYLDNFHVYQSFSNLNERFDDLLFNSNLPMKINVSSLSKSELKEYDKNVLSLVPDRIRSFIVSDVFMYEYVFSSISQFSQFQQLRTVIFRNIESKYIENLLDEFHSLPFLNSLVISCTECIRNRNVIYRQVFRLPVLKSCKLSLKNWNFEVPLEICRDEFSGIEDLVLLDGIRINLLYRLLSYVPYLRRLSVNSLNTSNNEEEKVSSSELNHLKNVSLKMSYVTFNSFIELMKDLFRCVEVFHLNVESYSETVRYVDGNQ